MNSAVERAARVVCLQGLASPRVDEWQRFVHTLQEMRQDLRDQEEDRLLLSSIR